MSIPRVHHAPSPPAAPPTEASRPFPLRVLARSLLLAGVVLTILMLPYPPFVNTYSVIFRDIGRSFFTDFAGCKVLFREAPTSMPGHDSLITVHPINSKVRSNGGVRSRELAYFPTALIAALIVASPVPWRRRFYALLLGLLLAHALVLARLALKVLAVAKLHPTWPKENLSPAADNALTFFIATLIETPTTTPLVVTLIWAAVTLRQGDWHAMTDEEQRLRAGRTFATRYLVTPRTRL